MKLFTSDRRYTRSKMAHGFILYTTPVPHAGVGFAKVLRFMAYVISVWGVLLDMFLKLAKIN